MVKDRVYMANDAVHSSDPSGESEHGNAKIYGQLMRRLRALNSERAHSAVAKEQAPAPAQRKRYDKAQHPIRCHPRRRAAMTDVARMIFSFQLADRRRGATADAALTRLCHDATAPAAPCQTSVPRHARC